MGEVYRADDLTLHQSVAIKFLPMRNTFDAESVKLLTNEVRVARKVTHPNVCRVYDVGQYDGRQFMTMEFVDGENLATLLRRIGRLPQDKGVELAKQICAGLASGHDAGVLHRDLKPANIMIDGRGRAKITDFGLAGLASELHHDQSGGGTPAYMSPEQLQSKPATVASDIYALGLLLYEMFTGSPPFPVNTVEDIQAAQKAPVTPPSSIVPDLSPEIDRTILACLSVAPEARPAGAIFVSAALPGGNVLDAAREAGIVPSPELLASAGSTRALSRSHAAVLVGLMAACLLWVVLVLGPRTMVTAAVPLTRSADVLADRSSDILSLVQSGSSAPNDRPRVSRAYAFDYYEEFIFEIQAKDPSSHRWERLSRVRPSAIDFWYRQSQQPMLPKTSEPRVEMLDPPPIDPGMASVRLDPAGKLRELVIVTGSLPPDETHARSRPSEASLGTKPGLGTNQSEASRELEIGWQKVFELAGLELDKFEAIPSERIPPVYSDRRLAWRGVYPENPDEHIRIEAATAGGKLVFFRIVENQWEVASFFGVRHPLTGWHTPTRGLTVATIVALMSQVVLLGAAAVLAWRNLKAKIGDRAGAWRVAVAAFVLKFLSFVLIADHPLDLESEVVVTLRAISCGMFAAFWFWIGYIAVEPHVRRLWPETLVSWSRLFTGSHGQGPGWRDPVVGSNLAFGTVAGCVGAAIVLLNQWSSTWPSFGGRNPPMPLWVDAPRGDIVLSGGRVAFGLIADIIVDSTRMSMGVLVGLVAMKVILRGRPGVTFAFGSVLAALWTLSMYGSIWSCLWGAALAAICLLILERIGLLALIAAGTVYLTLLAFPIAEWRVWYAPTAIGAIALVVGMMLIGIASALGWGRRAMRAVA
jgi:serine/threonine-protein kinase